MKTFYGFTPPDIAFFWMSIIFALHAAFAVIYLLQEYTFNYPQKERVIETTRFTFIFISYLFVSIWAGLMLFISNS